MRKYLIWCLMLISLVIALRALAGFDEGLEAANRGDYTTALREWLPLAQHGDADAQRNLGLMYEKGEGVPQDYAEAVRWYRRAAEQGHANAQNNLGLMYATGQGVPQDYAEAVRWYRRAAEQGNANAQFFLGRMYNKGEGVPQDYAQAVRWYRRAAEQGNADAQNDLGLMYSNGHGVPQDNQQAYFWYNLAAAHFSPREDPASREIAARNRDSAAARLTPAQLAQAQAQARTWQPKPEPPSTLSAPSQGLSVPVTLLRPGASPQPSLRRDLIRQVQERLQAAGFNPGAIDGALGPQTQDALRWFQNTKGLLATGELDEKTLDALGVR